VVWCRATRKGEGGRLSHGLDVIDKGRKVINRKVLKVVFSLGEEQGREPVLPRVHGGRSKGNAERSSQRRGTTTLGEERGRREEE